MSHWAAHMGKYVIIIVIFFTMIFGSPEQAQAGPTKLTYKVYAGGVNAIDVDLNIELKKSAYAADLSAYTRGFLGKLVPWRGTFDSIGMKNKDILRVREHRSISTWKGQDDTAIYNYDANGHIKSLKMLDNGIDKSPDKIDPTLTKNTTDILTATLNMLLDAKNNGRCDGSSDIFDSRRRFTLQFKDTGPDILKQSRYTFYQGPTRKCTIEVIPNGGAWHKKPRGWLSIQEQGRKKGSLPTIWIAPVKQGFPPMPVKIMIKTDYGTMFVHLADMQK